MVTSGESDPSRRGVACLKAQQEYEARRQAHEAAERERQRRADEEATRRRQMEAAAQETAEQAAAKERSRAREEADRVRKAEEVEAARQRKAQQEAERAPDAAPQQPRAEQFMPGPCATADLTAKCAIPQDPVLDQIRKSQENAARGRPSR